MMSSMTQLRERVRAFFAAPKPNECGTCRSELTGLVAFYAVSAPGRYCSEACADEGEDSWGW